MTDGRRHHPRAARERRPTCGDQARPAEPHARRRRQEDAASSSTTRISATSASPSSSPGTRRPAACCRSRSTTCSRTRTCWPAPRPRSTRARRRPDARPDHRAGAPAHLRPADPEGVAAAVADRAGFTRAPYEDTLIGGRYAIPARTRSLTRWRCTATRRSGATTPRVQPRPLRREAGARPAAQRLQALRHRPAGLHRPPVRPAGGACSRSAMLLQRFKLIDHRDYELKVKQTLTIKPDGLQDPGAAARPQRPDARP